MASAPETGSGGGDGRERLVAVAAAIASGIGVVGFVTVVGGILLWIRFNAVGIPADKAVASIPSPELVTTGLATLIPFIILGLFAAFLAYLYAADNLVPTRPLTDVQDLWSGPAPAPPTGPPEGPAPAPGVEAGPEGPVSSTTAEMGRVADIALSAAQAAEAAADLGSFGDAQRQRERAAEAAEQVSELAKVQARTAEPEDEIRTQTLSEADAARERARLAEARAYRERWQFRIKLLIAGAGLVIVEMIIVVVQAPPTLWHGVLLFVVAVALAAIALVVGRRTRGFYLFGAAVFLAVLLFGTIRTIVRTIDSPRVQAIAVLRAGVDYGITGYYIAETGDRVYLARIRGEQITEGHGKNRTTRFERSTPRIVVLPRSGIAAILIGPSQTLEDAYSEGGRLLHELCREKVLEAPAAQAATARTRTAAAATGTKNPCPP